jgi:hypothetical protein
MHGTAPLWIIKIILILSIKINMLMELLSHGNTHDSVSRSDRAQQFQWGWQ